MLTCSYKKSLAMHRCNATFYDFYGVKNDMSTDQTERWFICKLYRNHQSWSKVIQKSTVLKIVWTEDCGGSRLKEILKGTGNQNLIRLFSCSADMDIHLPDGRSSAKALQAFRLPGYGFGHSLLLCRTHSALRHSTKAGLKSDTNNIRSVIEFFFSHE